MQTEPGHLAYPVIKRLGPSRREDKIDWLPWLRFFINSLKQQKDHLAEKTEALEQYSALSHESMLIMQYVDSHHRITIRDAKNLITTITRPTIKNRLSDLVKQGLLIRNGKARGT